MALALWRKRRQAKAAVTETDRLIKREKAKLKKLGVPSEVLGQDAEDPLPDES